MMNTLYRYLCKAPFRVVSILTMAVGALFLPSCGGGGGHHNGGFQATSPQFYIQTNLVSDGTVAAANTDSNLVNPWGISFSPTGPFWVSDNGTGVATLYDGAGQPQPSAAPLVVTIPPPQGSPAGTIATPTGQVYNGFSGFVITDPGTGNTDRSLFIFATEDGTISGWNSTVNPTNAILAVDNSVSKAVYKGLAISSDGSRLYATNFQAGTVEVFSSSNFVFLGSFTDPNLPPGFAPFGIRDIDGQLFVTFAVQNDQKHDDVAGTGNGFIDVFDENGSFVGRFASGSNSAVGGTLTELNSPWGLALAPADFGPFSNALLVGNFGDGRINAFDSTNGNFLGQLKDSNGNPIEIDGLWALTFGNGGNAGNTNELFFTAGINDEKHGLFGKLTVLGP